MSSMPEALKALSSIADELYLKKEIKLGGHKVVLRNLSAAEEAQVSKEVGNADNVIQETNMARVTRAIVSLDGLVFPGPNDPERLDFISQARMIVNSWPQAVLDRASRTIQSLHNESKAKIAEDNNIDLDAEASEQLNMMRALAELMPGARESLSGIATDEAPSSGSGAAVPKDRAAQIREEFQNFPGKMSMPDSVPVVSPDLFPPGSMAQPVSVNEEVETEGEKSE